MDRSALFLTCAYRRHGIFEARPDWEETKTVEVRGARLLVRKIDHRGAGCSQVMPRMGQIEALIAQREIRDSVFADSQSDASPIVKRGIFDEYLRKVAVSIRYHDVGYFAAMAFDKRDSKYIFCELFQWGFRFRPGKILDLLY
jgi:hypothetical protein